MVTTIGSRNPVPWIRARHIVPARQGADRTSRLHTMALSGIRRARLDPWFDPLEMVERLGRVVLFVMGAAVRARLDGDCLEIAFVRGDARGTGLNAFLGDALILFEDAGEKAPAPSEVVEVAGYLAMPDASISPHLELVLQTHMPLAFMQEHQRRRRWEGSGFYVR